MLYARVPSLILQSYWEFFDSPEFAYSGLCIFNFADQVFREDHPYYKELEVLFA